MAQAYKLPFGRYKDQPIDKVPSAYLVWLHDVQTIKDPLYTEVRKELHRRYSMDAPSRGVVKTKVVDRPITIAELATIRGMLNALVDEFSEWDKK